MALLDQSGEAEGLDVSDEGRLVAGRYRLIERIGRGGMGTVWRAEDELLGRDVAVKKLHTPRHLGEDELATLYERTRREARSAARITHANVVVVHDVVEDSGLPCVVMEYVPSSTLGELLERKGPLSPAEAARIGRGMVAALRAAHAAGVLHRDVKPGNVLLGADGRVVLTDFGIAIASGTSTLTRTGELIGSIDYLAPERVRGGKPGPASDLWALGATLYQALEGRPPFRKDTAIETAYSIATDPLDPPRSAGSLAPLVTALLAKDPAARPSMAEAERALCAPEAEAETAVQPVGPMTKTGTTGTGTGAGTARAAPAAATRDARTPHPGATVSASGAGRGRRTALWAVTAAVVAGCVGGAAVLLLNADDGGGGLKVSGSSTGGGSGSGDGPAKPSRPAEPPPVPEGYHLVREKRLGVSFAVPDGWRLGKRTAEQVDYVDPTGMAGLRINALDLAGPDHVQHFKDVEEQLRTKVDGYEQLRMQSTTFRSEPAAIWEFTFQGRQRQFRAADLGFGHEGGREYAVYLSAPSADWDRYKPVFDRVKDGLRLPARVP
ncbi:serine/threonine-protein kinase [Streptomyces sp. H27-D2]|uniref:serine/threonine-protein kinase n=1 Tax=Streptomyces sp. H27-D2 TaxID=3046304 RepID=UPI002DB8EF19|nr:serine/threonine-protein kinase [Streptomyces sp. H27-D2]MEC4017472.1 serine/threonine-protein kinase [Streptomyces sp. H27-D2]